MIVPNAMLFSNIDDFRLGTQSKLTENVECLLFDFRKYFNVISMHRMFCMVAQSQLCMQRCKIDERERARAGKRERERERGRKTVR